MSRHYALSLVVLGLGAIGILTQRSEPRLLAQGSPSVALRGHMGSADEPSMEGVIVTAKKAGATISTSVVTDATGKFEFPASRLDPGSYTLGIRAAGYDPPGSWMVTIKPGETTTIVGRLEKTKNLSAQLTNAEWLASFPGTDAQKADIRGCAH